MRIQNKHLSERLIQRQKLEADLREKIELLQTRKTSDDSKLCIIDRYWTQLDEDLDLLLERFDSSGSISGDLVDCEKDLTKGSKENINNLDEKQQICKTIFIFTIFKSNVVPCSKKSLLIKCL